MLLNRLCAPTRRASTDRLQDRLQVTHEFVVTQGAQSVGCLEELAEFFGVGQVIPNRRHDNHREDLFRYAVRRREDLIKTIVPFFTRNPLRTSKRVNFEKFAECLAIIATDEHLSRDGSLRIVAIAETMNRQRLRPELTRILRGHTPNIRDTG